MVIALAGRRVDPPDADIPRFPLANTGLVRGRLEVTFRETQLTVLVCSAACGADLLALEAARKQGSRFRIVLPFSAKRFRETSVIDRPGGWGPLFDDLVVEARASGDLIEMASERPDDAYGAANQRILEEAARFRRLDRRGGALALIVWDGTPRGEDDATAEFEALARADGLAVREVRTL